MNVILPVDKIAVDTLEVQPVKEYKTLYLLHGLLGNYTDWIANTKIAQWAQEKEIVVVMPSGDNSFYVDGVIANTDYGEFIGKELVEVTRRMFHLSCKREDTFIAGLSMGGFGALRNGLKYNDTFGYIAGLSSALNIFELPEEAIGRCVMNEDSCFGQYEEAITTDKNPKVALENLLLKRQKERIALPKIFMACGTEDGLLDVNRKFVGYLKQAGFVVTYIEDHGGHDWDFWNYYIKKVLDWLPLDASLEGLHSGHVQ